MFSPTLAIVSASASATVMLPALACLRVSTSVPAVSAISAIILTRPWNRSLRATKSVSELTSTTTPLVAPTAAPIRPSAATRPAFLAALASPFLRRWSTAFSMSPSVSASADLQSIMPAPVRSRSSLTIGAVILAIGEFLDVFRDPRPGRNATRAIIVLQMPYQEPTPDRPRDRKGAGASSLGGELLGLRDPALHAARQADLLADPVRGLGRESGDLPVVEDAEIVELLLDRGRDVGELLEVVGDATGSREDLVTGALGRGRQVFGDRLGGGACIHAHIALGPRNSVDGGARDQVAIEIDRAAGVVIARDQEGDSVGIAVGIDHGGNRNIQTPGLLDR